MYGNSHAVLTRAEQRVLRALRDGLTHQESALRLGVDVSTLRWHVGNLRARTDTHTRVELLLAGARRATAPGIGCPR